MRNLNILSHSPEQTAQIAQEFASQLKRGDIVAFFGDLGSGKTTFLKSLIAQLNSISSDDVHSPTFSYLHIYPGEIPVYHFDLYRLKESSDFISLGFQEFFQAGGICFLEWSEKITSLLPDKTIKITLLHAGQDKRYIQVVP